MRYLTRTFSLSFPALAFSLVLLLQGQLLSAQNFDRYRPLQCSGQIPAELLKRSSEKFARQAAEINANDSKQDRQSQENFLLQSNFAIDELLLSGKALFNDPLSEYVTRVKDYLLRDLPEVREKIRIYVVKSPSVNAFATNDGIILVNMGLLARLQNEAELAFILCHEFQHFIHAHPINQYVNTQNLKDNRKLFTDEQLEDFLLAKTQYSRELELEADKLGMELYLKTAYSLEAVDGVFDLLRYAYLPFDQRPWNMASFESDKLRFPKSYALDSVSEISAPEDYDDATHSHPNIGKRRSLAAERLVGADKAGRSTYIFGEDGFLNARKQARFELCQLYLDQRRYEHAIYNAYLLQDDTPESFYLAKIIGQALYGLARHRNDRNFYDVHQDYEDIEGEAQQLFFFMEQLEKEELNIMALSYCWPLSRKYPDDNELEAISNDLLDDFFYHHRDIASNMLDGEPPAGFFEGYLQNPDSSDLEDPYYQYALADLFNDTDFALAYEDLLNAPPTANHEVYVSPRRRKRLRKKARLQGKQLGLDKVVFVDPIYKQIDERKKVPIEYMASEKAWEDFVGMIRETASTAGLDQELLSNRQLKAGDVARFNDLVMLEKWIADYMRGENDTKLINVYTDEALALAEKYGTDHFAFTGTLVLTQKKSPIYTMVMVAMGAYIITIPYVIYKLVKPKRAMLYLNLVFDVANNEIVLGQTTILRMAPRKSMLKSHLYDSMHQMKMK